MFDKLKKFILLVLVVSLMFPAYVYAEVVDYDKRYQVSLEKCVDGDTARFSFSNGDVYSTRFLAVDTPESVHPTKGVEPFGKEASEYTCNRLTNAKKIELEYDKKAGVKDKYDRLLAWIYVDDNLLQLELIREGLAEVAYVYGDYKYVSLLEDEQVLAKQSKIGKWGSSDTIDDNSENDLINDESKSTKTSTNNKKNSLIDEIIDATLGRIFDYLNNLIEKIVESIESML